MTPGQTLHVVSYTSEVMAGLSLPNYMVEKSGIEPALNHAKILYAMGRQDIKVTEAHVKNVYEYPLQQTVSNEKQLEMPV